MDGSDVNDLFNQLVRKAAKSDVDEACGDKLTPAKEQALIRLLSEIEKKGVKFSPADLEDWQQLGVELPTCLILLAAFLRGLPLPLIEDPEVHTEPLGGLGVCLLVDAKLFSFWDAATSKVHMPSHKNSDWVNRVDGSDRFATCLSQFMTLAFKWNCHRDTDEDSDLKGNPDIFVWGDSWGGDPPKTVMDKLVRLAFHQVTLEAGIDRLERVEFEREMRKAFGKG